MNGKLAWKTSWRWWKNWNSGWKNSKLENWCEEFNSENGRNNPEYLLKKFWVGKFMLKILFRKWIEKIGIIDIQIENWWRKSVSEKTSPRMGVKQSKLEN